MIFHGQRVGISSISWLNIICLVRFQTKEPETGFLKTKEPNSVALMVRLLLKLMFLIKILQLPNSNSLIQLKNVFFQEKSV